MDVRAIIGFHHILFGVTHDAVHHFNCFERKIADGGFAAEHASVCTIEDCIRHVGCFGTRRSLVMVHAIEHLSGYDHRTILFSTNANDSLLRGRSFGNIDLDTEITSRHHHCVGRFNDFIEVF